MLKQLVLTTTVITLISGVALTANLLASDLSNDGTFLNSKPSVTEEAVTNSTDSLGSELSTAEETKGVPLSDLRDISEIVTHHGNFVRTDEQTIFDESQIAREKKNIGPKTMQIILDYGIFLRKDHSK
ncbi:hypothetical protein ABER23_21495 [Paenibacillus lautus]|uniref:hypothetical protein n=1 Tax=Paenibacillus lautus TaxID=1401 RepID=UPI003D2AA76C